VQRTFEPIAREKGIELAVTLDPELDAIETDAGKVQQILKNLLSNAFKFTERGQVSLRVSPTPNGEIAFAVSDTGIGIPSDRLGLIFEAFRQADGSVARRYGGTGLGLAISRDLGRLLGGEIRVESEVGVGSAFTLTLPSVFAAGGTPRSPVTAQEPPSRMPVVARPASGNGAPVRPAPAEIADDRGQIDPKKRLILVIEDDPKFAAILVDLAHELEFQCVAAFSGEEGLELASKLAPSAVLLDVQLPDCSGLSVLDRLKQSPATRHIPVHMASVSDHAQAAREMGAIGYVLKPAKREELLHALRRLEATFTRALRRVLVIEDDAVQRESICLLLGGGSIETVAVATAEAALAELRTNTFDCVVTDLALPDASGYDLLETMANDETCSFPPVVVYTGRSLTSEEEQRLRRFSDSIIVKGARSPERLLDEVMLFLHQVESELPAERQRMLKEARDRETIFEGRRILVADDDVRNIFALSSVLEPKGAKIEIARNGREALEALEQRAPIDLVLMDVMMPEMDGLTAMREIRSRPPWAKLPIIAITAKAMRDDQEKCLRAGANDYASKPLDVERLLSLIRVWMPR
jgi:CheY-like chemotaxis protein